MIPTINARVNPEHYPRADISTATAQNFVSYMVPNSQTLPHGLCLVALFKEFDWSEAVGWLNAIEPAQDQIISEFMQAEVKVREDTTTDFNVQYHESFFLGDDENTDLESSVGNAILRISNQTMVYVMNVPIKLIDVVVKGIDKAEQFDPRYQSAFVGIHLWMMELDKASPESRRKLEGTLGLSIHTGPHAYECTGWNVAQSSWDGFVADAADLAVRAMRTADEERKCHSAGNQTERARCLVAAIRSTSFDGWTGRVALDTAGARKYTASMFPENPEGEDLQRLPVDFVNLVNGTLRTVGYCYAHEKKDDGRRHIKVQLNKSSIKWPPWWQVKTRDDAHGDRGKSCGGPGEYPCWPNVKYWDKTKHVRLLDWDSWETHNVSLIYCSLCMCVLTMIMMARKLYGY